MRYSASDLARIVGSGTPTAQQQGIIEGDPRGTFRIVAGAGSGKTETMAQRVLWLIANSHVAPSEVLGLTFTKKAARELSSRIRSHLSTLVESGVGVECDEFDGPTVSTYNAFAAGLYRDNAILLGRDPDASVLSEASAWALTRRVVASSLHPGLSPRIQDPKHSDWVIRWCNPSYRGSRKPTKAACQPACQPAYLPASWPKCFQGCPTFARQCQNGTPMEA